MLEAYADRWALVTGASSGIGAEFARTLAARGMHLVLTARRENLLREVADEVHTRHGARFEIIPCDLTQPGQAGKLFDEVTARGISLELLVNNAGFGIVSDIENTDVGRILDMLQLNIAAMTELTYRVIPGMLERQHGAVINVASVAGFQPVAYMGAYAASKTFVLHFSEALWAEVRERGVTVMALCPGATRTDFFNVAGAPGWLKKQRAQTPAQVVRAALKAVDKGRQYTVSGWWNYLLSLAVRLATRRVVVTESTKYFRPKKKTEPEAKNNTPARSAG